MVRSDADCNMARVVCLYVPWPYADLRESFNDAVRRLAEHHHLSLVRVGAEVALEAILIAALLATHLAVPS
jgi:hypothetical protein